MNEYVKNKWVKALRSGKYKQGRKNLNYNGAYCCLGVLCEVYLENCDEPKIEKRTKIDWDNLVFYGRWSAGLPDEVHEWSGLSNLSPAHLIHLNDTAKKSFAEIADYIEKEL
ncbi:MAG: hypothetical protein ACK528_09315 [Alphaproteobacteria bacterium]|jgi:hypothetical protein